MQAMLQFLPRDITVSHDYRIANKPPSHGLKRDDAINDSRRELVRRVAAADRNANREIYDTLENE